MQALAEAVEDRFREDLDLKPLRSEGRSEGEWILLDFGDIIVHLFQEKQREYYGLERLWADAAKLDWTEPVSTDG